MGVVPIVQIRNSDRILDCNGLSELDDLVPSSTPSTRAWPT